MTTTPLNLWFDLSRLAFESNMVVALRMVRLAGGDQKAWSEAQLMVSEKVQTAMALAVENSFALAGGKSMNAIGSHSVAKYRTAVRKNHERLSR
ncbi:hypothetical protein JJB09_09730 [Rhizobium sp. KVB221]|uniref:Uncharacterized protein n=1 Tax=Rhizobium setariae TaxID=2801340 RepID=A0A937CPX0_9HYPH|nr:hypothetical protein [Rhizobium setariae]MBL0372307.1 hypothetical protein [Rhizobium setariae]